MINETDQPLNEALIRQAIKDIGARWKQCRISEVLHLMRMNDISIDEIRESQHNADMGNTTITFNPAPADRNTVAGS